MVSNDYYIEATLSLLTEEQAGTRIPPIFPKYRQGHFCVDGTEWPEWIATFSPVDRELLNPGETGPVLIHILNDAFPVDQLWIGKDFRLGWGGQVWGHGTITGIHDLDERARDILFRRPL